MRLTPHIEAGLAAESVKRLSEAVRKRGGQAMLVGGCVRDTLLGRPVKDIDIEVFGISPGDLKALAAGLFRIDLVGQSFGVIKLKGLPIDVSIPRRESKSGPGHRDFDIMSDPALPPQDAAARRDFTINAMSCDPLTGELFDYFGGLSDLNARILRHTSSRFTDDPLRVLRGMQFVARFEMRADPATVALCHAVGPESLAVERVGDEWSKLVLQGVRPALGLDFLRAAGWLAHYPELAALVDCPQEPRWHPEGDVWTHTLKCMDAFARERVGDDDEDWIVGMATLCHDFGKPATTVESDGRIRSLGHDQAGMAPTRSFLERLTRQSARVEAALVLVRLHMRPADFRKNRAGDAAIRRLAAQVQRLDRLVRVAAADLRGTGGCELADDPAGRWLMERAEQLRVKDSAPKPLVLGRHLIALGMTPGPQFGPLLRQCYEAQLDGVIASEEEGIAWVRQRLP